MEIYTVRGLFGPMEEVTSKPKGRATKEKRKELTRLTKDRLRNINRADDDVGSCIICGKEIKKNQAFRDLPKDKNCKEVRIYHVRTCGPGSENWKLFKANGKKAPEKPLVKGQLSFKWKAAKL